MSKPLMNEKLRRILSFLTIAIILLISIPEVIYQQNLITTKQSDLNHAGVYLAIFIFTTIIAVMLVAVEILNYKNLKSKKTKKW